jgi:hypothetical protein
MPVHFTSEPAEPFNRLPGSLEREHVHVYARVKRGRCDCISAITTEVFREWIFRSRLCELAK